MKRTKILLVLISCSLFLASCTNTVQRGIAPYVYLNEKREGGYNFVEYYPDEVTKTEINKEVYGEHYLNSYYDGKKLYLSLSHTFFVYDSETKQLKELTGYVSNAIKKINGEIWLALDNGLQAEGYSSSLCKITEALTVDCLYEMKNQQVTDFYIDFEQQVFFGAGAGLGKEEGDDGEQYKIVKYNMQTGEETSVRNNGKQILAGRLTHICPNQFITSDGDIYHESGEKIGEVIGTRGEKLKNQINDLVMNETIFLDYDYNLLEVYGCENNQVKHLRTIELDYTPDIYPGYHSWETTDSGEITMPILSEEDIFESIGIQSVNVRTGEVAVYLFDEPIYRLHSVARFL